MSNTYFHNKSLKIDLQIIETFEIFQTGVEHPKKVIFYVFLVIRNSLGQI